MPFAKGIPGEEDSGIMVPWDGQSRAGCLRIGR